MAIEMTRRQPWYAAPRLARMVRDVRRYPILATAVLVLVLIVPAIFAPLIAPQDPVQGNLRDRLVPPAWVGEKVQVKTVVEQVAPQNFATEITQADAKRLVEAKRAQLKGVSNIEDLVIGHQVAVVAKPGGTSKHLLGADKLGRDILSRMIYGSRVSIIIAGIAIAISGVIGTGLGVMAGYYGGWVDGLIMRMVDVSLAIPIILLALVLVVSQGPGFDTVIIVLVVLLWARYARLARGETLSIRTRDFVARAKVAGASDARIMLKHVVPNIFNSLIVLATLQVGFVIVLESTLSFLGAGIPRPTPAWGLMVADGRELIVTAWWVAFFPGLAILFTCLSINLLGDWLRDRLDPKQNQV